ncbi:hypothetical protein JMUB7476_27610 [Staphylococcus aureus]
MRHHAQSAATFRQRDNNYALRKSGSQLQIFFNLRNELLRGVPQ